MGEICTPEAHRAPYRVGALQETLSDPQPPASPLPSSVTLLIHGTPTPTLHIMPDPPPPRPVSWGLGVSAPCRPLVNGQRTEEPSSSSEASAKGIEMTWYRGRTWGPWPDEAGCGEPMMDRVSVQRRPRRPQLLRTHPFQVSPASGFVHLARTGSYPAPLRQAGLGRGLPGHWPLGRPRRSAAGSGQPRAAASSQQPDGTCVPGGPGGGAVGGLASWLTEATAPPTAWPTPREDPQGRFLLLGPCPTW